MFRIPFLAARPNDRSRKLKRRSLHFGPRPRRLDLEPLEERTLLGFYPVDNTLAFPYTATVNTAAAWDFNDDGKVGRLDMGLLLLYWGTDDSRYDIGPTPFGDGIVDCKDLMVLAEHGAFLAGDTNYDGVVDLLDLAELAKNWLQDNNP